MNPQQPSAPPIPPPTPPSAGTFANPNPAFNISATAADAFLSALAVSNAIIVVQAQIAPVSVSGSWPAPDVITIEVRENITSNPNVGFGSLSPWFENNQQALINSPMQIEVLLLSQTERIESQFVNLAQFIADWNFNQNATLETTFVGINLEQYASDIAQWVARNTPPPPQPLPPI